MHGRRQDEVVLDMFLLGPDVQIYPALEYFFMARLDCSIQVLLHLKNHSSLSSWGLQVTRRYVIDQHRAISREKRAERGQERAMVTFRCCAYNDEVLMDRQDDVQQNSNHAGVTSSLE